MFTVCMLVLCGVFLLCGWAIFRAAGAITEQEIQPPDPEPRIVPLRPWQQAGKTIVLSAAQQGELVRIYLEDFVAVGKCPEMPLLVFFQSVMDRQRNAPIEVEMLFAQLHGLRSIANEHGLAWLHYAIDRAFGGKELHT